eukprot:CAMPEP_0174832270 /NCGR_PEP_ID=MMETSP1114-20130205/3586_1 /TAXON_ID=312471 /ORGANISM="Neobodo designis, Strain CCAP 1951/1" /LENGTH=109 /DNA_ID=CAMNT_0016066125 /DNA_START=34 /DNA_END=363 /DNA_ORIENTATION=-
MSDSETGGQGGMEAVRAQRANQQAQQAQALDRLHASIMVTHSNATAMGQELSDQDRLIGRLEDGVSAANNETRSQTRAVGTLVEETRKNGFMITVAVLVTIIIVLLALP